MGNVLSLHGAVPSGEAVPEIVTALEDLLARAKSGEVQALAWTFARRPGDGFTNGWEGNAGTRETLGASISHLQNRFFRNAYCDHD